MRAWMTRGLGPSVGLLMICGACSAVTDFGRFDEDPSVDGGMTDAPATDAPLADGGPDVGEVEDAGADTGDACASEELCNGVDDDCDERVDEGIDLTSDPANCGECGVVCEAGTGAMGVCTDGACSVECEPNRADCDAEPSTCETVLGTIDDCGGCNDICGAPTNVAPSCDGDPLACGLGDCLTNFGDCDDDLGNGCEVFLPVSNQHCGACGNACTYDNASGSCSDGTCMMDDCFEGFADCDGMETNGCEETLGTVMRCAACDDVCTSHPQVTTSCGESGCTYTCQDGFDACDGVVADDDGCEADLTSTANCGACGNACPDGDFCDGTACVPSCTETVCGGACVDTQTSTAHCGTCGNVCPSGENGNATCAGGSCGFACDIGFADCDATTGCEASLDSPSTCGSCGNDCQAGYLNGSAACASGTCGIGTCNPGFADCDGDPSNGCEADLTSIDHCTDCGNRCETANGTPVCGGGGCAIGSCDEGYGDCDGDLDCDLLVDSYVDMDGDTFGVGMSPVPACPGADGFAAKMGDCNDADPDVHPDAFDGCNRRDDDCDARVDEELLEVDLTFNVASVDAGRRAFVTTVATRGLEVAVLIRSEDGTYFFAQADDPDGEFLVLTVGDREEATLCAYSGGFVLFSREGNELFRQRYLATTEALEDPVRMGMAMFPQDLRCAQYNGSNAVVLGFSTPNGLRRDLRAAIVSALGPPSGTGFTSVVVGQGGMDGIDYALEENGTADVLFAWADARAVRTARLSSGSVTMATAVDMDTANESALMLTRDPLSGRHLLTAIEEGVLVQQRRLSPTGQPLSGEPWTATGTASSWVATATANDGVFTRLDAMATDAGYERVRAAPPYPTTNLTFVSDAPPGSLSGGHPSGPTYVGTYWMEGSDLIQEPIRCE